jgi:hypothetical protein
VGGSGTDDWYEGIESLLEPALMGKGNTEVDLGTGVLWAHGNRLTKEPFGFGGIALAIVKAAGIV